MTITQLHQDGTLQFLFDKGYISDKIFNHLRYSETFKEHRKNHSYRQACSMAASDHKVSIETIKRAIKGSKL